jgi:hypothetical protein
MPSHQPDDPAYRRLRYCRYADDSLFGFAGPKAEAEQIKAELERFLRDELKLEISPEKTLITHAATRAARFLGYEITVPIGEKITTGRRATTRRVRLRLPRDKITAKAREYMSKGKPAHRAELVNETDHQIVAAYGAEYRGFVQYYLLAGDVFRPHRLRNTMELSMLRTLAAKHHSTVKAMRRKHKTVIDTPHGKRTAFEARIGRQGREPLVARFGGIPLKRDKSAHLADYIPREGPWKRRELVARLQAGRCELCGARGREVEAHQVRSLKALNAPDPPPWARQMARMRRKTLIVCAPCHATIHADRPATSKPPIGKPDDRKPSRPVWGEATRKRTQQPAPRRVADPTHHRMSHRRGPRHPLGRRGLGGRHRRHHRQDHPSQGHSTGQGANQRTQTLPQAARLVGTRNAHRAARQRPARRPMGPGVPHPDRAPPRGHYNDRQFRNFCERHPEWAWVVPKTFRKTAATLVGEEFGLDVARAQLDHSSSATTAKHYTAPPDLGPDTRSVFAEFEIRS